MDGVRTMNVEDVRPAAQRITILYDERCALCRRVRDWLLAQPCLIQVELLPAGSSEARKRYGDMPWLGEELVVADDQGRVWVGPAAYLTCLWATLRYRSWSYRLSSPRFAPLAERFFRWVTKRRDRFSAWLEDDDCTWCDQLRVSGADR
ncbi:MAG: DUF393 domain-containing protein [Actinobacteria bacterium]|nr:DUF393 domain-containing protein [Actinomycetota bacterium]